MSEDVARSKTKERKAQRDAERKNSRNKKRKAVAFDESGEVEEQKVLSTSVTAREKADTTEPDADAKENPSSKKRKQSDLEDEDTTAVKAVAASQPKKRRKSHPANKDASDKTASTDAASTEDSSKVPAPATKSRFILFVGNLPYSTTDVALNLHFAKLFPYTLRHRTDPKTKKSKGFAFLEFENYDRMKTCLSQYHHSMFDPDSRELGGNGKGNGRGGRQINVELTAGGGGKTEGRKEKIRVKNERLQGQRERRAEAERKEKIRKERKEALKAGKDVDGGEETKSLKDVAQESGIHPSRLARLNG